MPDSRLHQQKIFLQYHVSALFLSGVVLLLFYLVVIVIVPSSSLSNHRNIWTVTAGLLAIPFSFYAAGLLLIKPAMLNYKWLTLAIRGVVSAVVFGVVVSLWQNAEFTDYSSVKNESTVGSVSDIELLWALNQNTKRNIHKLTYHIVHQGIDSQQLDELSKKFGVSKAELHIFIALLKRIPAESFASESLLDIALTDVISRYHRDLKKLRQFRTDYPDIQDLQTKARHSLREGDFEPAEVLIKGIDDIAATLARELNISLPTLSAFFDVIYEQHLKHTSEQQRAKLQDFARQYHKNIEKMAQFKTDDLEIKSTLQQVKFLLENGELGRAEEIIEHIGAQDLATAHRLQALSDSYFSFASNQLLADVKATKRHIAERLRTNRYYVNLAKLAKFRTDYPEIKALQVQAKRVLEQGEFDQAEALIAKIDQHINLLAEELLITPDILDVFFSVLRTQNTPAEQTPTALRNMASSYQQYLSNLNTFKTDNDEVRSLRSQVKYFLEHGEFDRAESFLNRISSTNVLAAKKLQAIANDYFAFAGNATLPEMKDKNLKNAQRLQDEVNENLLSAAEAKAQNAELKLMQIKNQAAGVYFKEAAELIPKEFPEKLKRYTEKRQDIETATAQ